MNIILGLLSRALTMSTPLLFGASSEVIAERSGMMITAIEGIFLMGAWGGFVGTYYTGSPILGVLLAMFCGLCLALIYGLITITMQQNQVVTGAAINLFAGGFCTFFQRVLFGVPTSPLRIATVSAIELKPFSKIPIIGEIFFKQTVFTYSLYLLIPAMAYFLYQTSWGLSLRSCGENPVAVDTAGLNITRIRYLAVIFSGLMGGIAGAFYSIAFLGMFTSNMIGGRGWIAFAICFLGNWTPFGAVVGTFIFGLAEAIGIYMQSSGSAGIIPNEFFIALPYILTIVLTVARRKLNVPAQLGVPYIKEEG